MKYNMPIYWDGYRDAKMRHETQRIKPSVIYDQIAKEGHGRDYMDGVRRYKRTHEDKEN